jgi:hypothetical protein
VRGEREMKGRRSGLEGEKRTETDVQRGVVDGVQDKERGRRGRRSNRNRTLRRTVYCDHARCVLEQIVSKCFC